MKPWRKVDRNLETARVLKGKRIYLALYADRMDSEARVLVDRALSKMINCGKPLDDLLAMIRAAVLDSARAHGNVTAQTIH